MLSAIICTYNREKYLIPLLESIAAGSLSKDAYELIVVDNNCMDGTADACARFAESHPELRFRRVCEPEQGLSAARNRGIAEAGGDVLVYVDDDALVGKDFLAIYADWFSTHPQTMAAGGPIIPEYECGAEPEWIGRYTRALLTAWMDYGKKVRKYPKGRYPGGGNAAYRKEVFVRTGLFNTSLGRKGSDLQGGEEKDIFCRMESLGMEVLYLPGPVLHHCIPDSKLTAEHFGRLTLNIGRSERSRTLAMGKGAYAKRLLQEGVKWAGTLLIALLYTIRLQGVKARQIILFRRNVTRGLLGQ